MKSDRKAGRRERREFSAEFKPEAVRLVAERRALGVTLAQVGRELDVRPDQLREWARKQAEDSGTPGGCVRGVCGAGESTAAASLEYQAELAAHGMVASMSAKGDCYDNAVAESFFSTLEFELLMKNNWHT